MNLFSKTETQPFQCYEDTKRRKCVIFNPDVHVRVNGCEACPSSCIHGLVVRAHGPGVESR